jgi:hypothetical protein
VTVSWRDRLHRRVDDVGLGRIVKHEGGGNLGRFGDDIRAAEPAGHDSEA